MAKHANEVEPQATKFRLKQQFKTEMEAALAQNKWAEVKSIAIQAIQSKVDPSQDDFYKIQWLNALFKLGDHSKHVLDSEFLIEQASNWVDKKWSPSAWAARMLTRKIGFSLNITIFGQYLLNFSQFSSDSEPRRNELLQRFTARYERALALLSTTKTEKLDAKEIYEPLAVAYQASGNSSKAAEFRDKFEAQITSPQKAHKPQVTCEGGVCWISTDGSGGSIHKFKCSDVFVFGM